MLMNFSLYKSQVIFHKMSDYDVLKENSVFKKYVSADQ